MSSMYKMGFLFHQCIKSAIYAIIIMGYQENHSSSLQKIYSLHKRSFKKKKKLNISSQDTIKTFDNLLSSNNTKSTQSIRIHKIASSRNKKIQTHKHTLQSQITVYKQEAYEQAFFNFKKMIQNIHGESLDSPELLIQATNNRRYRNAMKKSAIKIIQFFLRRRLKKLTREFIRQLNNRKWKKRWNTIE